MRDKVATDVLATLARWQSNKELQALARLPHIADPHAYSIECAIRAIEFSKGSLDGASQERTIRFCLITKQPHATSTSTVATIIARALAFGVSIHNVHKLGDANDVARVIYPAANLHFMQLPGDATTWQALEQEFDNTSFDSVFGVPYSRSLVMTGHQAMQQFGLTANELTVLWEAGRQPVGRDELVRYYGSKVAAMILDGRESYEWFRGRWPLGIHRIAPGLVAFALRHERLGNERRPVIILNGHYPGLAGLFGNDTVIVQAGVVPDGARIDHIRRWLVGDDNRPAACQPASIRRDAHDGLLYLDAEAAVDSRKNVLHCSDGILTGMIESMTLFRLDGSGGELADQLMLNGLTEGEISSIVAEDPIVAMSGQERRLSNLTAGQGLNDCVRTVLRLIPPVFGPANGYASGLTLKCLARELAKPVGADHQPDQEDTSQIRALRNPPTHITSLPEDDEQLGRAIVGEGRVGLVVPAGGTGGRFGGYDLAESDPRRQKALLRCFRLQGGSRCALDIRAANAAYWRAETGGQIPVAVMGSPTNQDLLRDWRAQMNLTGLADITLYEQFGAYRIKYPSRARDEAGDSWWVNNIVRHRDGTPSLKPPGNLGTLTCLILSGIFGTWSRNGTEYLVIANGDDVGFRLDPRILGFLGRHPFVDAVITVVPWGIRGSIVTADRHCNIRADASGWCLTDTGEQGKLIYVDRPSPEVQLAAGVFPIDSPSLDVGGRLCEVAVGTRWRLAVAESTAPSGLDGGDLLSTNQVYLRASALSRVMGLDNDDDVPGAVARFVSRQPFHVERKVVSIDDAKIEAVQLNQAISGIFQQMSFSPMEVHRTPSPGQYGGNSTLKTRADIAFAQFLLNDIAAKGDQLAFC